MSLMKSIYSTQSLKKNGIFISLVLVILVGVGYLIPAFKLPESTAQVYTLNGLNLKYNDQSEVSYFYQSIVKNKGYLVLGTSESTKKEKGNYYNFLNNDPEIKDQFSVLAGAGRTCGIHIPIFLQHKEELKGLKLIYFINPVYWRTDLCELNMEYWNRYNNYKMVNDVDKNEINTDLVSIEKYHQSINFAQASVQYIEQLIRSNRRHFFHDLYYQLNPEQFVKDFEYVRPQKQNFDSTFIASLLNWNEVDTIYNISTDFQHKEWFSPINPEEDYRYKELEEFIELCNEFGIETTFIVGPYNQKFIETYSPNSLSDFKCTTNQIKELLNTHQADYIDATVLSNTMGAYIDHQHHSSYGGFLIYQIIKSHLYEK